MGRCAPILFVAAVLLVAPAGATEPFELARGLREAGSADLALEYLGDLEKGNPPPEVRAVLPLERAQARLDQAATEGDPAVRAGLAGRARAEFEQFLKSAPVHPRRAEATAAVARLVGVQARGQLAAANDITGAIPRAEAMTAARDTFQAAAKQFAAAAAAIESAKDAPGLTPAQKARAVANYLQARVDEGVNLFQMAQTYAGANAADRLARATEINKARGVFEATAKAGDPGQPLTHVARAWAGECYRAVTDPIKAQAIFDEVKAVKTPASAAGARLARFFETKDEYEKALSFTGNKTPALVKAQNLLEQWLADYPRGARPTPELFAARYYVAFCKYLQARPLITPSKTNPDQYVVPGEARALLRAAERDFRRAIEPANDYSARATEFRNLAIRFLVGDPEKAAPATMTDFDLVLMSGQVLLARATAEDGDPAAKKAAARKAALLFDRLAELPPPPQDAVRDVQAAGVLRVFALMAADRPHEAAVLGDHLARTGRGQSAARAGLYAVQAYRQGAPKDSELLNADLDRSAGVANYLDATYPLDPSTDAARLLVARQLVQAKRYRDGFELAAKVPTTSPSAAAARFVESVAALELLRPEVTPDAATRKAVLARALADLTGLPPAAPSAADDDARTDLFVRLQLAELHLAKDPPDLAAAEAEAKAAVARAGAFTGLGDEGRKELLARAELTRGRAAYGRAIGLFKADKFAEAGDVLTAAIGTPAGPAPAGDGSAAAAVQRLTDFRRDRLLGLAIQARLRAGQADQIAPLLDTMKRLGGLANAVNTLGPVLDGVRPQLDALRKSGKTDEADRVAKALSAVIDQVTAGPDVDSATLIVLGRGVRDLGDPAKAVDLLKRVPAPANRALLNAGAAVPDADSKPVARYRLAQLELVRSLRQAKQYPETDAVIKSAAGWVGANEFRKEAAYLLEAQAADGGPDGAKRWGEAYQAWNAMANGYAGPLRNLLAGRKDPKSAVLSLLALKALPTHPALPKADADIRAGFANPKPPAWVAQVLGDGAYQAELQKKIAELDAQLKPLYHDHLAESFRCLALANENLLKGQPADKLNAKYDTLARALVELEKGNPDIAPPVRQKLVTLVADRPGLREAYTRREGKAFLAGP